MPAASDLVEDAEDALFEWVLRLAHHVLYHLLPNRETELTSRPTTEARTHRFTPEISREIGIHQSSVFRIIHDDLGLKCLKKCRMQELTRAIRMQRTKKLLVMYLEHIADSSFYYTVSQKKGPPVNSL